MHWEEQRKAMQADQYNKAELARWVPASMAPQWAHMHARRGRNMVCRGPP